MKNVILYLLLSILVLLLLNIIQVIPSPLKGVVYEYENDEGRYCYVACIKDIAILDVSPNIQNILRENIGKEVRVLLRKDTLNLYIENNFTISRQRPFVSKQTIYSVSESNYSYSLFQLCWIQFIVSCLVFLFGIIIWHQYYKGDNNYSNDDNIYSSLMDRDFGVFFFGAALLLWGWTGIIDIYNSYKHDPLLSNSKRYLSIINNFLFALSFPYFRHGMPFFKKYITRYVLVFIFVFLITLIFVSSEGISSLGSSINDFIEVGFTTMTFFILGYLLDTSFRKRNIPESGALSWIIILAAMLVQSRPIGEGLSSYLGDWFNVLYGVSFFMTLILYVALVYSWYTENVLVNIESKYKIKEYKDLISTSKKADVLLDCFHRLLAENRLRIIIAAFSERFKGDTVFCNELSLMDSRLSTLKSGKNKGTTDRYALEADFARFKEGLIDIVVSYIKNAFPEKNASD